MSRTDCLCLSPGRLSLGGPFGHHPLNHLDSLSDAFQDFLVVRYAADEQLEILEHVGLVPRLPQLYENRLDLSEHKKMLAVRLIEHLLVEAAIIYQGRRHLPVRDDHPNVPALRTHHRFHILSNAGWIETKKPVSRFAHHRFAAKVVEFQN